MRNLVLYSFILCNSWVFGQTIKSKISDSIVVIGQQFIVTYSIEAKVGDSIQFVERTDFLPARAVSESGIIATDELEFELISTDAKRSKNKKDLQVYEIQYTVVVWDSGLFVIPGPNFVIDDSMAICPDLRLASYLTPPKDGMDLYDIREDYAEIPPNPFSIKVFLKKHWWWLTLIVVAIVLFFVIRAIRRRRLMEEEEEERPMSLKDRTLLAIDALEKAKLWERDQLKEHFVELSYIVRSYLTARYSLSLLEKTTHEARLMLTQQGLERETVDVIIRILSQSDMVKFAKSKPDVISILRVSAEAKQVVAETSPLDFDNVE